MLTREFTKEHQPSQVPVFPYILCCRLICSYDLFKVQESREAEKAPPQACPGAAAALASRCPGPGTPAAPLRAELTNGEPERGDGRPEQDPALPASGEHE